MNDVLSPALPAIKTKRTRGVKKIANPDLLPKTTQITIPERVIVKPYSIKDFKLGLEKTKEQFVRIPGVKYRWAPSKVGNTYQTGLQYISVAKKKLLEQQLGQELNAEFYANLTYVMDGSNPNGINMDLRDPYNIVVYLAFIDSDLVASSKQQIKKGKKPFAEWYIENDEAEAEALEVERDKTLEMFKVYEGLSTSRRASFCKLLGLNVFGISNKVAATKLWAELNQPGKKGVIATKKFLEISQWGDEKIAVSEEVEDALAATIIRRNSAQDFIYGNDIIGGSKDQVISKLLSDDNLRQAIKNQLSTYRY